MAMAMANGPALGVCCTPLESSRQGGHFETGTAVDMCIGMRNHMGTLRVHMRMHGHVRIHADREVQLRATFEAGRGAGA